MSRIHALDVLRRSGGIYRGFRSSFLLFVPLIRPYFDNSSTLQFQSCRLPRSRCRYPALRRKLSVTAAAVKVKSAVSTAVFRLDGSGPEVLLVKRGKAPNLGLWALPGGSVEPEELLPQAAARELLEETLIPSTAVNFHPLPVHVVQVPVAGADFVYCINVFAATMITAWKPIASDDAAEAAFYPLHVIPSLQAVSTLQDSINVAYDVIKSKPP